MTRLECLKEDKDDQMFIYLNFSIFLLQKNGAYSFKGMRYAAPPIGNLRWAPPAEPLCRNVATDAGRLRSACPQVRLPLSSGKMIDQEDCLFINVWTPTLQPNAKLPVMVWIHGGFLDTLSGGEPGYSPTEKLAADTGVVYVSFNYRLNVFGFLALEMLREGSPKNTSGESVKSSVLRSGVSRQVKIKSNSHIEFLKCFTLRSTPEKIRPSKYHHHD